MLSVVADAPFTVMVILFEVAVVVVTQVLLEVNTQLTTSPLFKPEVVKVLLLVPAFTPFTLHWKAGAEPPLVGVAVKVTDCPLQMVVLDVEIETAGVTGAFTVMVMALEVAGLLPTPG
jgi:hypothetical protein